MFSISYSNKIKVTQKDNGIFELQLNNYTLKDGDKVYFSVKSFYNDEILIFKEVSTFNNGIAKFLLTSQDTDIECGEYIYDIQCNLLDGRIDTVIPSNKFIVMKGVTDV